MYNVKSIQYLPEIVANEQKKKIIHCISTTKCKKHSSRFHDFSLNFKMKYGGVQFRDSRREVRERPASQIEYRFANLKIYNACENCRQAREKGDLRINTRIIIRDNAFSCYREEQQSQCGTRGSEGPPTGGSATAVAELQRVLAHKLTNANVAATTAGTNVTTNNNSNNNNNSSSNCGSLHNQQPNGNISNNNSRSHSHSQSHNQSVEELHRLGLGGFIINRGSCSGGGVDHDSVKVSMENTNTCTDSLVTAIDDEALLLSDFLPHDNTSFCSVMNHRGGSGKVHFGGDDLSLYGTPKEELGPIGPMGNHNGPSGPNTMSNSGGGGSTGGGSGAGDTGKQSFIKNQLQALFQPTDNKLAMKLFGSKKALMKERIRQKETGHWVIHPCSSFR